MTLRSIGLSRASMTCFGSVSTVPFPPPSVSLRPSRSAHCLQARRSVSSWPAQAARVPLHSAWASLCESREKPLKRRWPQTKTQRLCLLQASNLRSNLHSKIIVWKKTEVITSREFTGQSRRRLMNIVNGILGAVCVGLRAETAAQSSVVRRLKCNSNPSAGCLETV
jgi:hypothetical protein